MVGWGDTHVDAAWPKPAPSCLLPVGSESQWMYYILTWLTAAKQQKKEEHFILLYKEEDCATVPSSWETKKKQFCEKPTLFLYLLFKLLFERFVSSRDVCSATCDSSVNQIYKNLNSIPPKYVKIICLYLKWYHKSNLCVICCKDEESDLSVWITSQPPTENTTDIWMLLSNIYEK